MISAISNEGAVRFMTYTGAMTAALFITFLGRLRRSTSGKLFVIVDWLKPHHAGVVEQWWDAHEDELQLWFLPRYAPELNADEYLNNDVKGEVGKEGLPEDRPQLRSRILSVMQRLLHLPQRVRNYFKHPCLEYATEL